jgi:hypothetical protein
MNLLLFTKSLHDTRGFKPDRQTSVALYSTGALGRLTPQDCLGYIDAFKGVPLGELPSRTT